MKHILFSHEFLSQKAEECLAIMAKKFKVNVKVWLAYGLFRYKKRDYDGARALLNRAIQVLHSADRMFLCVIFVYITTS